MTNDQHYKVNFVQKPERPVTELDSSDDDWALFIDTWNQYKEMCKLTNPSIICNELRTACTPELNRLLFDLMGAEAQNTASEDQLLQYIKLIMVRGLHKEVHRQNFHSMKQKEGESITHFLARLRTLAKFYEFTVTCPNKPDCGRCVDYSNDIVAGQMVAGLANMDHQTKMPPSNPEFPFSEDFYRLL